MQDVVYDYRNKFNLSKVSKKKNIKQIKQLENHTDSKNFSLNGESVKTFYQITLVHLSQPAGNVGNEIKKLSFDQNTYRLIERHFYKKSQKKRILMKWLWSLIKDLCSTVASSCMPLSQSKFVLHTGDIRCSTVVQFCFFQTKEFEPDKLWKLWNKEVLKRYKRQTIIRTKFTTQILCFPGLIDSTPFSIDESD